VTLGTLCYGFIVNEIGSLGFLIRKKRSNNPNRFIMCNFRRKLSASVPTAVIVAGVVTLLGVAVGIHPAVQLRMKILDLVVSMATAQCVIALLGPSSWSPNSTQSRVHAFGGKFGIFLCSFLFFL
jgi:hypothetical protein